jgi:hypothetical protein
MIMALFEPVEANVNLTKEPNGNGRAEAVGVGVGAAVSICEGTAVGAVEVGGAVGTAVILVHV